MRLPVAALAVCTLAAGPSFPPRVSAADAPLAIGYCTDDPQKAKDLGFDYAELGVRNFTALGEEEFAKFVERVRATGLPTPVGNVFFPGDMKLVGPEADHEKGLAWARKALARAKTLGLEIVVFGSGGARKAPEGYTPDQAFRQLVAFAKRLGPEARRHGIVIAVEPLRREETNTINSVAEGLRWVEAVRHPNFQLMTDFYHLAREKEDPAVFRRARKHIRHVHIANPAGRVFPMAPGEADYAAFFRELRAIGYRGRVSVEARTTDAAADAPRAIAFLRAVTAGSPKEKHE